MAKGNMKKSAPIDPNAAPVAREFPRETLFVAVSDNDGPSAGEDGGPEKGGRGAWARGEVAPWTASHAVPLALRDPKDGTIARGFLEVVLELGQREGKTVCLKSQKVYAVRIPESGEWVTATPSERAVKRAEKGASTIADVFQPAAVRQALASRQAAVAHAGL